jgi:toluene monooxygenase system protein D
VNTDSDVRGVGPVLQHTPFGEAVVEAIREENDHVVVHDEGAYLRVLVPGVCRLSRSGLQALTGLDVQFPGDLELVMSSFTGVILLTDDVAEWSSADQRPEISRRD